MKAYLVGNAHRRLAKDTLAELYFPSFVSIYFFSPIEYQGQNVWEINKNNLQQE